MTNIKDACPCGTGFSFSQCCEPFIKGTPAPTAEKLMRSRYSAYVKGAIDYIADTHLPDPHGKDDFDKEAAREWSAQSQWLGLEIKGTKAGLENDQTGVVEFVARYKVTNNDQVLSHQEISDFVKVDNKWLYKKGTIVGMEPIRRSAEKIGRNDPCHCGSGKKFKKCHGA